MSTTYSIVCDECKEVYGCGQSNYFYDSTLMLKYLERHIGHKIRFVNDAFDDESTINYEDYPQK